MKRGFFVAVLLLIGLAGPGFGQEISSSYAGTYTVSDSTEVWNVTVSFSRRTDANGETQLDGTEHFVSTQDRKTSESEIHAVITRSSLKFVMAELSKPDSDFTPMVYGGTISSDMQTIEAAWSGGERAAYLKLHAVAKAGS